MKRILLTTVMAMVAMVTWAYDVKIDGIYYNLNSTDKTAVVTSNSDRYSGSITIPNAFAYYGVTYSVTSIGEWAFSGCSGLTSVTIPNSVTSIRLCAFSGCSGLTSLTIPNSVTSIWGSAFFGCSGLTSLTIGNSVTSIEPDAFCNCSGLTSVAIPNSVTSIGYEAFSGCSGLTSVTIPNSVTSIGGYAFDGCSGLTSVTIPNSVTSIGDCAFRCPGLESIMVESGNTVYESRENCNAIIEKSSNTLIIGCKNTTIPNSVTSIGKYAFRGCTGLTSLTIPNSVTSIGERAFGDCTGLKEIHSVSMTPPSADTETFKNVKTNYCKLYVPVGSKDAYCFADGWANFLNIIEEEYKDESQETCATPTIQYADGKLTLSCETPDVEYHISVSFDSIVTKETTVNFGEQEFTISVYAEKTGYNKSEVAAKKIILTGKSGDVNGDGVIDIADVNAVLTMMFAEE